MKRSTVVSIIPGAVVVGVAVLILVSAGNSKTNTSNQMNVEHSTSKPMEKHPNDHAIATNKAIIKNFEFAPNKITIRKGTKVTWTNQDTAHHDITPDEKNDGFKAGPLFGKGESYSYTFNDVGTFAYHCSPHPYMKASIEVTE
jgi:plastocyanin